MIKTNACTEKDGLRFCLLRYMFKFGQVVSPLSLNCLSYAYLTQPGSCLELSKNLNPCCTLEIAAPFCLYQRVY